MTKQFYYFAEEIDINDIVLKRVYEFKYEEKSRCFFLARRTTPRVTKERTFYYCIVSNKVMVKENGKFYHVSSPLAFCDHEELNNYIENTDLPMLEIIKMAHL